MVSVWKCDRMNTLHFIYDGVWATPAYNIITVYRHRYGVVFTVFKSLPQVVFNAKFHTLSTEAMVDDSMRNKPKNSMWWAKNIRTISPEISELSMLRI